jgi:hypothetical protein
MVCASWEEAAAPGPPESQRGMGAKLAAKRLLASMYRH